MGYLLCLVPILAAFIVVSLIKRPFESVIVGLVVGVLILGITTGDYNFPALFVSIISAETADAGTVWVIIFTLLIGIFVEIIDASKATAALSSLVTRKSLSEKRTLLSVLTMGVLVYPDEFLKGIVLCSYGKDIGRKSRVSMSSISLCIIAICIPLTVVMPFTTYSTYFAQLLSSFGLSENYTMDYITKVIPFLFFPIALVVIIFLFAFGIIPKIGVVKKDAEAIKNGTYNYEGIYGKEKAAAEDAPAKDSSKKAASPIDFAVPLIVLVVTSLFYGGDLLVSLCITLVVMFVWFLARKILTFAEFMDAFFRGMNSMLKPTAYLVLGFAMTGLVDQIGFPELVSVVTSWMAPAVFLPFIFVTAAIFGMLTGMLWPTTSLFLAACLPISETIGISPFILAATLFSSAALASVLSPRGSLIMLISQELKTDVVHEMKIIRPYTLMAGGIATIAYLLVGFMV